LGRSSRWKIFEMNGRVEKGSSELEKGGRGTARGSEGRAVGVGEDLEEELGREAKVVRVC
jgi:hypothetical protein